MSSRRERNERERLIGSTLFHPSFVFSPWLHTEGRKEKEFRILRILQTDSGRQQKVALCNLAQIEKGLFCIAAVHDTFFSDKKGNGTVSGWIWMANRADGGAKICNAHSEGKEGRKCRFHFVALSHNHGKPFFRGHFLVRFVAKGKFMLFLFRIFRIFFSALPGRHRIRINKERRRYSASSSSSAAIKSC